MRKKLVVSGCSFTDKNYYIVTDNQEHHCPTWGEILAKELDIPIVALSQLSRAVEQRTGSKRPQLSDLRESGAIEQDADVVLFLFRPWVYSRDDEDEGKAEIIIAKQRNGPTGIVEATYINRYTRFENLALNPDAPF